MDPGASIDDALTGDHVGLDGHNRDEEKGADADADRKIPESDRRSLVKDWLARA